MIYYQVPEVCPDSFYLLKSDVWDNLNSPNDFDMIASDCGEDYYSQHDGWENSWPLVISLHTDEGSPEVARFSVDMEAVPQFSSREIERE